VINYRIHFCSRSIIVKSILCSFLVLALVSSGLGQTDRDTLLPDTDTIRKPVSELKETIPAVIRNNVETTRNSAAVKIDSPIVRVRNQKIKNRWPYHVVVKQNPYYNFFGKPIVQTYVKRKDGKEELFYLMIGLILYFALIRLLFLKYLHNMFIVFFRISLKQKQIREQLLQTPLPSLLLNILFVVTGGIYISFLLRYFHFAPNTGLFWLGLYSSIGLIIIYMFKFVILKFLGWIFNIVEATDMYIFIVFLVNKLLGIFLIPFLILLAFSGSSFPDVVVVLSIMMVIIAFVYRYIASYAPIRKQINVSQLHFFLYLCGFEIIPLLVLYKVLLSFLERTI